MRQTRGADRRERDVEVADERRGAADRRGDHNWQFVTFHVGDELLGLRIEDVQEVLTARPIAPVPLASRAVAGFLNLRGQIVTAVDLRRRLGLPARDGDWMNVVVRDGHELFSLLVDAVGDVIEVRKGSLVRPPATLAPAWRDLCEGVAKLEGKHLLIALHMSRLLTH